MTNINRRKFIAMSTTATLLPASALLSCRWAIASDLPLVDETSDQAVALKYVAESATDGQTCANCSLYQGTADSESAACALFPGNSVAAGAWCSAWVPKS